MTFCFNEGKIIIDPVLQDIDPADVAELADALGSGSSGGDTVGVRLPSSASTEKISSLGADFLRSGERILRIEQ